MNTTVESVSTLSRDELKDLVDLMVEDKLVSLLGDPEDGLEIRDDLKERLLRQRGEMRRGEKKVSLDDGMTRLRLA